MPSTEVNKPVPDITSLVRKETVAVQQVPADRMLPVEFETLGVRRKAQEKAINVYEEYYIPGLMEAASSAADEAKAYESMSRFLYGHGATCKNNTLLFKSIRNKAFNCYSSAAMCADALARLDMEVSAVFMICDVGHVFLVGPQFVFETTSRSAPARPKEAYLEQLGIDYPNSIIHVTDVGKFLAATYDVCGLVLNKKGKSTQSITAHEKATTLFPEYEAFWLNRGAQLERCGIFDHALRAYETATELNPRYTKAWYSTGSLLIKLYRYEDALAVLGKALQADPEYEDAWRLKAKVFDELNMEKEAHDCTVAANTISNSRYS
jgi:tetratricopeptide (TPR) repeat protein